MNAAIIGLIGTIVGAGLGLVAATFAQDRARLLRAWAVVAVVLSDVERLKDQVQFTIPAYDPGGGDQTPALHRWTKH